MIKPGLRETPEDKRDLALGALIRFPKLAELPESFELPTLGVKDQKDTDFCTAYASCLVSEIQEGVALSPEYQFALSKMLARNPDAWGQDIRAMLKSHTKIGALEQRDAPYSLENQNAEFLRKFSNWPGHLLSLCGFHKKQSYWKVSGPYDHFDNIRAALWKFKQEKRAVVSGVVWQWPLEEYQLHGSGGDGFGHCLPYLGWTPDGLIAQNSAGPTAGQGGRHAVSRETINHFVEQFGAYMLIDLSTADAQYYLENGIKLEDNWLTGIFKALFHLFK